MSSHRRPYLLVLVALIFVLPGRVRGQDVSGTWISEVPVRVANHGGTEHVEETAKVTLVLDQQGDAVTATWQMDALPDNPTPPAARTLAGVVRDGRLILTDTTEAMIQRNGELPFGVTMIQTFELTLEGDRLAGQQSAVSEDGTISSMPQPFVATRATGPR